MSDGRSDRRGQIDYGGYAGFGKPNKDDLIVR
jgi:hypothetical protein